jgi:hypothetical protein
MFFKPNFLFKFKRTGGNRLQPIVLFELILVSWALNDHLALGLMGTPSQRALGG